MKKIYVFLCALVMLFGLTMTAGASLTNPGFETGDFTGWTVNDTSLTAVVTSAATYDGTTYYPPEGNYFAVATAGLGASVPTTISQDVSLVKDAKLAGYALFDGRDYMGYNDYAFVTVGNTTVWSSNIAAVGDYGHTPWQYWSFVAPSSDSYTLTYGVSNYGDNALSSQAYFDAVPLPSAILLLGPGLIGLAAIRRRFKK